MIRQLALSLFITFSTFTHPAIAQGVNGQPQTIPDFTFYRLDNGQPFKKENLPNNNQNHVILFFDPVCTHCQHEVTLLNETYHQLRDVNLYLIAMQEERLVTSFLDKYGSELKSKQNVYILQDKNYEFISKFNPGKYPATYVYKPGGELKEYWDGDRHPNEILKAMNSK